MATFLRASPPWQERRGAGLLASRHLKASTRRGATSARRVARDELSEQFLREQVSSILDLTRSTKEPKTDADGPLAPNWMSGEAIGYVGSHFDF